MSDWVFYPWNVLPLITFVVLLLLVGYFSTIKNKSVSTKLLITGLSLFAASILFSVLQNVLDNSGITTGVISSQLMRNVVVALLPVTSLVLTVFALRIGTIRFERQEKWIVQAVGIVTVAAVALSVFTAWEFAEVFSQTAINLSQALIAIILVLKWRISRKEDSTATSDAPRYLAFSIIFVMGPVLGVAVVGLQQFPEFSGLVTLLIESAAVGFPIAFSLVCLQYIEEPTSLEVKVVAGSFLGVMLVAQLVLSPINTLWEVQEAYLPPPDPFSIEFIPTIDGGYIAEGRDPEFLEVGADTLRLLDDSFAAVKPEFVPIAYGASYDSVYVGANAIVSFQPMEDVGNFTTATLFVIPGPSVSPVNVDLNPSQGGVITSRSSAESLILTWDRVPIHDPNADPAVERRSVSAQVIIHADGRIRITRGEMAFRFWAQQLAYGISPGKAFFDDLEGDFSIARTAIGRGNLELTRLPMTAMGKEALFNASDNRTLMREWGTTRAVSMLRSILIAFLLILILVPLYFRSSVRNRLYQLMVGMQRVNDGDLEPQIDVPIQDEIGQLSTSFNGMTDSLRRYSQEMEMLVDDRTSELKATQAQLIQQEKLASLGALTAGIAHEIKNPLNFVNNFAEVGGELTDELSVAISEGRTVEAQSILSEMKANSEQITKHGRRADDIVRSMMQHARGGVSEREEIAVNVFLEEYANLAWHGMRAREHGFQAELKREYDEKVGSLSVLPQELGRVILNLLNNAFDAVRSVEDAEVTIASRSVNGGVELVVSDNGPGISEDIRDKIFEPFFTTKATGEGTGLGLSLSYDIITKAHGGSMTTGSSSMGGAKFTITLPIES